MPSSKSKPGGGALVRHRRRHLGLSQAALAKAVGVSQASISLYESGDPERLSRGTLLILALRLELDPTTLDPSLEGVYHRVESRDLERGRVTLMRLSDGIHWTAEGTGIEGTKVIRDLDLGGELRHLAEQGIAVEVPAFPPVE